jgi:hypothetical protein
MTKPKKTAHSPSVRTFKLAIPLYDTVVWVVVAEDINKELERVHLLLGGEEGPKLSRPARGACSFDNGTGNAALHFPAKDFSIKLIAHEVFHLVIYLTTWKQMPPRAGQDEPAAMLCAWLVDEIANSGNAGVRSGECGVRSGNAQ